MIDISKWALRGAVWLDGAEQECRSHPETVFQALWIVFCIFIKNPV